MDQTRRPAAFRALAAVGIAFALFLVAEGLAHVSGGSTPAITTPAIAANEPTDPLTGAAYLPSQYRGVELPAQSPFQDAAPTF